MITDLNRVFFLLKIVSLLKKNGNENVSTNRISFFVFVQNIRDLINDITHYYNIVC